MDLVPTPLLGVILAASRFILELCCLEDINGCLLWVVDLIRQLQMSPADNLDMRGLTSMAVWRSWGEFAA